MSAKEDLVNTLNSMASSIDWLKIGFLNQASKNIQELFIELDKKDMHIAELSKQINILQEQLSKPKET